MKNDASFYNLKNATIGLPICVHCGISSLLTLQLQTAPAAWIWLSFMRTIAWPTRIQ